MKLFLDANVVFSACLTPQGNARALIAIAIQRGVPVMTSVYALGEARRNLAAKAPHSLDTLVAIEPLLRCLPDPGAATLAMAQHVGLVEKDAPVLAAAIEHGADLLATGDVRHFGHLFGQPVHGVLVLPPREALRHLEASPRTRRP